MRRFKQIKFIGCLCSLCIFISSVNFVGAQKLYVLPDGSQSRWTSSENPEGKKGAGAKENQGAKGHAFDKIKAHDSIELLNINGPGIVNHIRLTVDNRSPEMLRALQIKMYWDGAEKPAVSAPLGDFFGVAFGKTVAFENALFSSPEGRSFNCYIPMPFKKGARIVIYNHSDKDLYHIFYTVNFEKWDQVPDSLLYFHTYWQQSKPIVGSDFEILPEIKGEGRFLGANIGVHADSVYNNLWWGEGEVKIYLDGDQEYPTLVSTGVEDYIGTAWGMGKFVNRYQGCLIADKDNKEWAFYRYHIPDPVYFYEDIKVTVQQIGGGPLREVRKAAREGAALIPISVDQRADFIKLLEMANKPGLLNDDFPEGWTNFYRSDVWCTTTYFYLNRPQVVGNGRP